MENVPGIFSSRSSVAGDKSDFGVVLNEFSKLADETIHVPEPANGKWHAAGSVLGDSFSLAWRCLCASQFGLAQRRKRMFLVLCFNGHRAVQILSEQEGERRDFTPGYFPRKDAARNPAAGAGSVGFEPGILARKGGHAWHEAIGCLRSNMGDNQAAVAIYDARGNGDGRVANTLTGDHEGRISDYTKVVVEHRAHDIFPLENCPESRAVCYQDLVGTLAASDYRFPQDQQVREGKIIVERERQRYTTRRLLPKECLLLQGLPVDHLANIHISEPSESDVDFWYNAWEENRAALGKSSRPRSRRQVAKWLANPYSDANAYQAIGNSLAVPCALFVIRGIVDCG